MLKNRTIYPISGFGDIEFYTSPLDITTRFGTPTQTNTDENGDFILYYEKEGLAFTFEKDTNYTLSWIYFEKNAHPIFIDTDLFTHTPDSLIDLITQVGHYISEDDPSDDYPLVLSSPSLYMTFYFTPNNTLDAMAFQAPPKE